MSQGKSQNPRTSIELQKAVDGFLDSLELQRHEKARKLRLLQEFVSGLPSAAPPDASTNSTQSDSVAGSSGPDTRSPQGTQSGGSGENSSRGSLIRSALKNHPGLTAEEAESAIREQGG